jgi:hypothetical protein
MAETAQTSMPVYDLDLLPNDDVPEDGEERKHRGEGCITVDDKEGHVVYLETIRQIPYAGSLIVCVGDDYNFVSAVDEFRRELVDMTFDSPRLGEEEITDHSNVVRHSEIGIRLVVDRRGSSNSS